MTDGTFPGAGIAADKPGPGGEPAAGGVVNWPLVLGLAALAGIWPAVELSRLGTLIDTSRTAFLAATVVSIVWISWVGFFQVPRPVITLTMAGAVSGLLVYLLFPLLDAWPAVEPEPAIFIAILGGSALGVVTGLLAKALQQVRRARRRAARPSTLRRSDRPV